MVIATRVFQQLVQLVVAADLEQRDRACCLKLPTGTQFSNRAGDILLVVTKLVCQFSPAHVVPERHRHDLFLHSSQA
ncbi:hypothetical protein D3C80_1634260 [compost metagenome]